MQIGDLVTASTESKQSTPIVAPAKSSIQWQTAKRAQRHVSWSPEVAVPLSNRFTPLITVDDNDDDCIPEASSNPNRQETRSTPAPNQQSWKNSNFHPNQHPENQTVPTRREHSTRTLEPVRPTPSPSLHPNQRPENQTLPNRPTQRYITPQPNRANNSNAPLILIVGDRMLKQITSYDICRKLREHNRYLRPDINVKPFLGAQTRTMPIYLEALLQESVKPDIAIVHIGTNYIRNGVSTADTREDFVNLHKFLQNQGIEMFVSLLTCRSDEHRDAIRPTNHMLIELCDHLGIGYTGNENIQDNHLNQSGLHLHKGGSELLASNFTDTIINLC